MASANTDAQPALAGQQEIADTGERKLTELRHLPLERIHLNGNPRTRADEHDLDALAQSIRRNGVLMPVAVSPRDDGDFDLIAGRRRLEGAKRAGRRTIPAHVLPQPRSGAEKLATQVIENVVRTDMDAVDEAHAIAELMRSSGLTEEGIADLLSRPIERIRRRLELLELPAAVKQHVADGRLSLQNARTLAPIANKSAHVAGAIAERVADGVQSGRELDHDPAGAIRALCDEEQLPNGLFVIPFTGDIDTLNLCEVLDRVEAAAEAVNGKERERLAEAIEQARAKLHAARDLGVQPIAPVGEADQDRARAARTLIEYKRDRYTTVGFLTDPLLAADWARDAAGALASGKTPAGGQPGVADTSGDGNDGDPKEERKLRAERQLAARSDNERLGDALRSYDAQQQISVDQATVLCALILDHCGPALAGGLRLCRADWFTKEHRTLKSNELRTTVHYPDPDQARELLDGLLKRSSSGAEMLGRMFEAVAAAALVDEQALSSRAQRHGFALPYVQGREQTVIGAAPEALWRELEAKLPERMYAERKGDFQPAAHTEPGRDRLARRK